MGTVSELLKKIERFSGENILSPDNKSTLVMEYFNFVNGWSNEILVWKSFEVRTGNSLKI